MDDAVGPGETGSAQAGFTLIELLVSIAVVAVLAVGASLAATRRGEGESDAQRFAQGYAMARQMAVQGQDRRGITVTARGSRGARWRDGAWQDTGRETRWRGPVVFAPGPGGTPSGQPEIVFLSNGRSSAFSIRFGGGVGTTCTSDGWTGLTCAAR